jgi:hypothetical protein
MQTFQTLSTGQSRLVGQSVFLLLSVLWLQAQVLIDRATCREHSKAKKNFDAVVAKGERIKEKRESLKAKFKEKHFEVCELNHSFLRGLK